MTDILETVLLLALPASGKSEVRRYLSHLTPDQCAQDFHMGPTVQLDDFPYVHMMRRIDEELAALGGEFIFFEAQDKSFRDRRDWGTLIQLISEDYDDLVHKRVATPESAAALLLSRLDKASEAVGAAARCAALAEGTRKAICDKLESEAAELLKEKHDNYPDSLEGKTMVIEFARGGPDGSDMPLPEPHGYRYSLRHLSPAILEKANVLYVWVTPEESRRKNEARTDPNDPGSILHHGVPHYVMVNEYGTDDIDWLINQGGDQRTITINAHDQNWTLPIGRFDNRVDKTSFLREDKDKWAKADVDAVHSGLKEALDQIAAARG